MTEMAARKIRQMIKFSKNWDGGEPPRELIEKIYNRLKQENKQ